MGLRALNNPNSAFEDVFSNTGYIAPPPLPSVPAGISATGGTKESGVSTPDSKTWTYHYFTSTGPQPFNVTGVTGPGEVEFIVIAGGGGGGLSQNGSDRRGGGGGGAGGLITNFDSHPYYPRCPSPTQSLVATVQNYTFTIGAAGGSASQGTDSTAFGLTSNSGGYGGNNEGGNATAGGSGGGAGATENTGSNPGASNPAVDGTRQGYPGGIANSPPGSMGGGGGGAGAAGYASDGTADDGGGGVGVAFVGNYAVPPSYGTTGPTSGRWFCGGGGAGSYPNPGGSTSGGAGGGGAGKSDNTQGGDATANTGGGGGGAGGGPTNTNGGSGGSGIIIVRYLS